MKSSLRLILLLSGLPETNDKIQLAMERNIRMSRELRTQLRKLTKAITVAENRLTSVWLGVGNLKYVFHNIG